MGERRLDEAEVGGSIPPAPTTNGIIKGPFTKIPALFYNKVGVNVSKYFFYSLEILLQDELEKAKNLLDVGTGPGHFPLIINQVYPELKVFGIDPSDEMIREAKRIIGKNPNIKIVKSSALEIPFQDETFDIVISNFSIKHWEDIKKGLNEVYRVLKKGGKFFCFEIDKSTSYSNIDRIFEISSLIYKFFARYVIKYSVRYVGVSAHELNKIIQNIPFHGNFKASKFLPIVYAKLSK